MHENSTQSIQEQRRKGKPYTYRRKIYEILLSHFNEPLTDRTIIQLLQESDVNNVRPEITRLKYDGIIEEAGRCKCPITGKTVRAVRLTGKPYQDRIQKKEDQPVTSGVIPGRQFDLFKGACVA